MTKTLCILGSTGSIGTQALEVCEHLGIAVAGLAVGGSRLDLAERQVRRFSPAYCAVSDEDAAKDLRTRLADTATQVLGGKDSAAALADKTNADTVLNAITGIAGLLPTLAAIRAKKTLALANKETLVAAGELVNALLSETGVTMLPVDSEHCAIHQCIDKRPKSEIARLILTASGGSLFGKTREELSQVDVRQALTHPNWSMGKKITVDSSTLVNKGLELIEAIRLFGLPEDKIDILVHRESVVHSMASFVDGSVMAQLAVPDMRLCIQYALTYPEKKAGLTKPLDLAQVGKLTFYPVDSEAFPSVELARSAVRRGGVYPCVFNGANEACVDLFLREKIRFTDIFDLLSYALETAKPHSLELSLDAILEADKEARTLVYEKAARDV